MQQKRTQFFVAVRFISDLKSILIFLGFTNLFNQFSYKIIKSNDAIIKKKFKLLLI